MTNSSSRGPRAPLDVDVLRAEFDAAVASGSTQPTVLVLSSTESTNADAARLVATGEAGPVVVAADEQTAGRGRLDRVWVAPPASSLLMSVAVRPTVPLARWGWIPLLAGVATRRALERECGREVMLKWPNDLLAPDGRKLGGILCERTHDGAAVIGVGINVDQSVPELPSEAATSLRLEGATPVGRERLVAVVTTEIIGELARLEAAGGDAGAAGLAHEYAQGCSTLGRVVTVSTPEGEPVVGRAVRIASSGGLVIDTPAGERELSAGDVVHVRPV